MASWLGSFVEGVLEDFQLLGFDGGAGSPSFVSPFVVIVLEGKIIQKYALLYIIDVRRILRMSAGSLKNVSLQLCNPVRLLGH